MNTCYLLSLLQLLLLTAVKDVANALGDLIDSTRTASGKSVQDPAMEKLKTSAKVRYCVIHSASLCCVATANDPCMYSETSNKGHSERGPDKPPNKGQTEKKLLYIIHTL